MNHPEVVISAAQYRHKMIFERLYCLLCHVAPVVVWWDKLVFHFVFLIVSLNSAEHSLSNMCIVGCMFYFFILSINTGYALIISPEVLVRIGSTKILLPIVSNNTTMYWFPLNGVVGNLHNG